MRICWPHSAFTKSPRISANCAAFCSSRMTSSRACVCQGRMQTCHPHAADCGATQRRASTSTYLNKQRTCLNCSCSQARSCPGHACSKRPPLETGEEKDAIMLGSVCLMTWRIAYAKHISLPSNHHTLSRSNAIALFCTWLRSCVHLTLMPVGMYTTRTPAVTEHVACWTSAALMSRQPGAYTFVQQATVLPAVWQASAWALACENTTAHQAHTTMQPLHPCHHSSLQPLTWINMPPHAVVHD